MKKLLSVSILALSVLTLGYFGSKLIVNTPQTVNAPIIKTINKETLSEVKFDSIKESDARDMVKTTTIIFDLGETLLEQDHMKMASEIGLFDIMFYKDKDTLKDTLFDVLYRLGKQEKLEGELQAKSGENIVPGIVCHWFAGKISSKEVLEKVEKIIEELDKTGYFKNKTEKKIVKNSLNLMFDPEKLSKVTKPIKKSLQLIKQLAQATDEAGNPLYELFILSNWDKESFEIFYNSKNGQKLFKHFKPENIIISGNIGQIKPHTNTFEYVINQLHERNLVDKDNLNHEVKFIDDQPENIEVANKLKIAGILFDKTNHEGLIDQLENHGISIDKANNKRA